MTRLPVSFSTMKEVGWCQAAQSAAPGKFSRHHFILAAMCEASRTMPVRVADDFRVDASQGICGPLVHPDDGGAHGIALPVNADAAVELSADRQT